VAETGITIDPPPSWQVRFEGPQNLICVEGKRKVTGHLAFSGIQSWFAHTAYDPSCIRPDRAT